MHALTAPGREVNLAALLIHARNAKTICADGYIGGECSSSPDCRSLLERTGFRCLIVRVGEKGSYWLCGAAEHDNGSLGSLRTAKRPSSKARV